MQDQPPAPHDHQVQKRIRGPNCGKNLKNTRRNENHCGRVLPTHRQHWKRRSRAVCRTQYSSQKSCLYLWVYSSARYNRLSKPHIPLIDLFFFFILQSTEACFCLRKPYLLSWGKSWHANTISTSKELLHLLTFCQSFSIRSGKRFIVILDASRKPKGILIQGWLHKREGKQAHPLDMQDTVTFQYRAGFERLSCVVAWCM